MSLTRRVWLDLNKNVTLDAEQAADIKELKENGTKGSVSKSASSFNWNSRAINVSTGVLSDSEDATYITSEFKGISGVNCKPGYFISAFVYNGSELLGEWTGEKAEKKSDITWVNKLVNLDKIDSGYTIRLYGKKETGTFNPNVLATYQSEIANYDIIYKSDQMLSILESETLTRDKALANALKSLAKAGVAFNLFDGTFINNGISLFGEEWWINGVTGNLEAVIPVMPNTKYTAKRYGVSAASTNRWRVFESTEVNPTVNTPLVALVKGSNTDMSATFTTSANAKSIVIQLATGSSTPQNLNVVFGSTAPESFIAYPD